MGEVGVGKELKELSFIKFGTMLTTFLSQLKISTAKAYLYPQPSTHIHLHRKLEILYHASHYVIITYPQAILYHATHIVILTYP